MTEVRLLIGDGARQTSTPVYANDRGTPHFSLRWESGSNLVVECPDRSADDNTLLTTKKNFTVIRYPFAEKDR